MLGRFVRDVRGQAAVVETVVMLLLLVSFFAGFSAYAIAAHARAVVIGAAAVAGRAASIQCGQGVATWQGDATAIAQSALQDGGLRLTTFQAGNAQPGDWYVAFGGGCASGGSVSVTVQYDQLNLFPYLAALLGQGPAEAWIFPLASTAVYPVD